MRGCNFGLMSRVAGRLALVAHKSCELSVDRDIQQESATDEQQTSRPVYVSAMHVSTDCGVEFVAPPPPGLAEPPGTADDRHPLKQQNVQWIKSGFPGAGNILIFNNGDGKLRP